MMDNRKKFNFGNRRLVNQKRAKEYLMRVLCSQRMGHAYLFTGPPGCGKTAFALAFAEAINGIENLSNLGERRFSKKSSWFTHPDIHLFLPMPVEYKIHDLRERLMLLSKNPYEIVDYNLRPDLADVESSKNKLAFYPIDYFNDEIRPKAFLKPNEGKKTVIILTGIEMMRKEAANAFLKLLEEPSKNLIFLLTTNHFDALLPTIRSRCQQIKLNTLNTSDIEQALVKYDDIPAEDARFLARISGGNYTISRLHDADAIKNSQSTIINFLRNAYSKNAIELQPIITNWQNKYNTEGQIMLLNVFETFLRDLLVYRETGSEKHVIHINQLETIQKFCENLKNAAIDKMIEQVNSCRPLLYQNVQAKLVFTALSFRLSGLMRNREPVISDEESWQHLPAFVK